MPKLCVHIATRNNARFLEDCLKALFADPFEDREILVLDDASEDGSWELLQRLAEGRKELKLLRSEARGGVARARQTLLDRTDADYYVAVDGDDILLPGGLEARLALLDAHPEFAACYGRLRQMSEDGRPLPSFMGSAFSRFNLPYANMVVNGGTMVRASDAREAGGYLPSASSGETVGEDLSLWLRLSLRKDLLFFDKLLYLYRQGSGQLTKQPKKRFDEALVESMREALKRRADLAGPLAQGRGVELKSPEDRKAAVLILSILSRFAPQGSEKFRLLVEAAGAIDPDDYGVALRKLELAKAGGRPGDFIALCDSIIAKWGADPQLRGGLLRAKLSVLEETGRPFPKDGLLAELRRAEEEASATDAPSA